MHSLLCAGEASLLMAFQRMHLIAFCFTGLWDILLSSSQPFSHSTKEGTGACFSHFQSSSATVPDLNSSHSLVRFMYVYFWFTTRSSGLCTISSVLHFHPRKLAELLWKSTTRFCCILLSYLSPICILLTLWWYHCWRPSFYFSLPLGVYATLTVLKPTSTPSALLMGNLMIMHVKSKKRHVRNRRKLKSCLWVDVKVMFAAKFHLKECF